LGSHSTQVFIRLGRMSTRIEKTKLREQSLRTNLTSRF
jgi:hypothetical protein